MCTVLALVSHTKTPQKFSIGKLVPEAKMDNSIPLSLSLLSVWEID